MCDPDSPFVQNKEYEININRQKVKTTTTYIDFGNHNVEQYFAIPKKKRILEVDDRSIINEIKEFEDPNTQ